MFRLRSRAGMEINQHNYKVLTDYTRDILKETLDIAEIVVLRKDIPDDVKKNIMKHIQAIAIRVDHIDEALEEILL